MINPRENELKVQIEDQEKSHKLLFQIETRKAMEGGGRAAVRSTYATLRLTHPNLPVELRDFQVVGWTLDCLS